MALSAARGREDGKGVIKLFEVMPEEDERLNGEAVDKCFRMVWLGVAGERWGGDAGGQGEQVVYVVATGGEGEEGLTNNFDGGG